jgi:2-dehydro-3-deoxyphosphogluconate aldolase/(4S)-4-hydroxy-2-oxoglutarate aldolase
MAAYLQDPLVAALGGSWIAPRDLITAGNWAEIRNRARTAIRIAHETRSLK